MTIEFEAVSITKMPRLVATARLVFGQGPLEGLMLTGFGIWQEKDSLSVTFPARPPRAGESKKHWYWFLRAVDQSDPDAQYKFRERILSDYRRWVSEQGV